MKTANKLDLILDIKNYKIYEDPTIKDMVDLHLKYNCGKYDIFGVYIIGMNHLMPEINNDNLMNMTWIKNYKKFEKTVFLKNGNINFRNPLVKYKIRSYKYLYVGNLLRNDKLNHVFLSIYEYDDGENVINGFSIDDDNDETYFFNESNVKKIGTMDKRYSFKWDSSDLKEMLIGKK